MMMKLLQSLRSLMVLSTLLFLAGTAAGQGTNGSLPEPVAARELSRYAAVLNLNNQQRLAIDAFHDTYIDAYTTLREGEIEAFLEDAGFMRMGPRMGTDVDAIKKGIRDLSQLMRKIKTLDTRLFDQIATVLSEDQTIRLPRVRQQRDRARHRTGLARFAGSLNPAVRVDVGTVIDELDLSPDVYASISASLGMYESSLTRATKGVYETSTNLAVEGAERLQEMGGGGDTSNRRNRREMFTRMRDVWGDLAGDLMKEANTISDLNRRTIRQMTPLLPEDPSRQLHDRFYQQAYGESSVNHNPAGRQLGSALGIDDLDSNQRTDITELKLGFFAETDRITDKEADLIEEQRRTSRPFFFGSNDDAQSEYRDKLKGFKEQRSALNDRTIAALRDVLGEERAELVDRRSAGKSDAASDVEVAQQNTGGRGPGQGRADRRQQDNPTEDILSANDPFLPGPIAVQELGRYLDRLAMEEMMREVVVTMHDDYRDGFRVLQDGELKQLRAARQVIHTANAEAEDSEPASETDVSRVYQLRRSALAAIVAIDGSLMDNIETLLSDTHSIPMERVRLARERVTYNRRGEGEMQQGRRNGRGRNRWRGGGRGGSSESRLDLATIFEKTDLEPTSTIDESLLDYERSVTAVFRESHTIAMRFQESIDTMTARSRAEQRAAGGGQRRGFGDGWRELMETDGQSARDVQEQIVTLNRASLDGLETILGATDGRILRRAYEERAFPSIFEDPRGIGPKLSAALGLDNLSFEQRSSLVDLSAEYHQELDGYLAEMVKVQTRPRGDREEGRRNWESRMQQRREMEGLEAERDNLNEKSLIRLRAALTAEQIRSLGLDQDAGQD